MSEHTPGPWEKDDQQPGDLYRYVFGQDRMVCRLLADTQGEADATLISAAPDLYEALVRLMQHAPAYPEDGDESGLYEAAKDRALAAIAKATS